LDFWGDPDPAVPSGPPFFAFSSSLPRKPGKNGEQAFRPDSAWLGLAPTLIPRMRVRKRNRKLKDSFEKVKKKIQNILGRGAFCFANGFFL
jgi:hypothetical protein